MSPTFANSDFEMIGLESKPEKLRFKDPFLVDLEELLCVCPDDRDFDFDLDRRRGAGLSGSLGEGVNFSLVAVWTTASRTLRAICVLATDAVVRFDIRAIRHMSCWLELFSRAEAENGCRPIYRSPISIEAGRALRKDGLRPGRGGLTSTRGSSCKKNSEVLCSELKASGGYGNQLYTVKDHSSDGPIYTELSGQKCCTEQCRLRMLC